MSSDANQSTGNCSCLTSTSTILGGRKYIPNSSPAGTFAYDKNNRSALFHVTYMEVGNAGFAGA
jgi:hypothetical protein